MVAAPPTWAIEPTDTKLEANSKLNLICDAEGYPRYYYFYFIIIFKTIYYNVLLIIVRKAKCEVV